MHSIKYSTWIQSSVSFDKHWCAERSGSSSILLCEKFTSCEEKEICLISASLSFCSGDFNPCQLVWQQILVLSFPSHPTPQFFFSEINIWFAFSPYPSELESLITIFEMTFDNHAGIISFIEVQYLKYTVHTCRHLNDTLPKHILFARPQYKYYRDPWCRIYEILNVSKFQRALCRI